MNESDKRAAALAAIEEVRPGMVVGLGTGSTAAFAIAALGERRLDIRAVATSLASAALARAAGIALIDLPAHIDLTIDGADEIDSRFRAIKGAGGAMLREKVVASASARMIVIADSSKCVDAIGVAAIPVEVLPFGQAFVAARLAALGGTVTPRAGFVSDQGNAILDCRFPPGVDHARLAAQIAQIPGALGHGLFLSEVSASYIAENGVVTRLERKRAAD
ncbi:ribose-5-phosphate isomerase RpiA [Sphingomonas sp. PAMC 26621]|uniref:ribose-5-phosphate isomerase RpiA n=1 Tax=Sphingomonas sp. PAMC 26621 TaxID=1112213 RepID=UPI00028894A8|nr:ribose-5-phosphate isomerase RpiA [Sphingomonas sp. PAMC 26621]